jgi:uncharacterized glyoxalase superfamily protein PhnB
MEREKMHRPEGFHAITPQLSLEDAGRAMDFYQKAFGAVEIARVPDPSGKKVWHGVMKLGDSMFFVNDTFPDMGGSVSKGQLWVYIPDVDARFQQAIAAGCTAQMPPTDMFWGDRMADVQDPFGQRWTLATMVKKMTPEEQQQAQDEFVKQMAGKR